LNYLLDTHIWVWSLLDSRQLGKKVRKALDDPENELWLSPVSLWEFLILVEKGRITVNNSVGEWLDAALQRAPMKEAPLTFEIARKSRSVRLEHEDPADRFLAATAVVLELTLITADERLLNCPDYFVLPNK